MRMLEDLECTEITIKYFLSGFMISHRSLLDTAERIASAKAIKKSNIEVMSMENLIYQVHSSSSDDHLF